MAPRSPSRPLYPRRPPASTAPQRGTKKPGTGHLPEARVQPQTSGEHQQQQNKPVTNPTTQQQPDLNKPDPAFAPLVPESGATLSQTVTKPTTPGTSTQRRPAFVGGGAEDTPPQQAQAQVPPQNQTVNDVAGTGPQTQPPVAANPVQPPHVAQVQTLNEQAADVNAAHQTQSQQAPPARPAHLTEKAESNLIKRGGKLEDQFKKVLDGPAGTRSIGDLKELGDKIVANQITLGATPEQAAAYAEGLMSPEQVEQLKAGQKKHANRPMNFQQFYRANYGGTNAAVHPVAAQRRYHHYQAQHAQWRKEQAAAAEEKKEEDA